MKRGRKRGSGRLWKRGAVWVLDYYDQHGVRHQPHLGPNKREAEALQAEIITRRNRITLGLDVAPVDIDLEELARRYLDELKARTTPRHVLNVSQQLARLLTALPAKTVGELVPSMFLDYRAQLLAKGRSTRCTNVYLQAIRGLLNWSVRVDLINANPLAKLRKLPDGPKHQKLKRRSLTDVEVERFLDAAQGYDVEWGTRELRVPQAPMWWTLVDTGARFGEMRQLTWRDLDERDAVLVFRAETTKAGRGREIPICSDLLTEIVALRNIHWRVQGKRPGLASPIFLSPKGALLSQSTNNPRRTFNQILKRAQIAPVDESGRKIDIHGLRHTFVSRLQRSGVSLGHAQRLAGHSDPKLTASIYTHLERDDLRKAIEALPQRNRAERNSATGT